MREIGSEIKELRKQNNMTLKDLSEKTGLSIGFLSQFERGLSTIAIDSLELIARSLDVGLSHFLLKPNAKGKY
ncbi:MAG: helix-turn-helix domain-containing protein, partial [Senegalia sp. (in: firmicutes)]